MIGAALALAISIALAQDEAPAAPPVTAVSGRGALTAGLDSNGVLSVLRFPGPGGPDQMRQAGGGEAAAPGAVGGGRWGIESGGRWYWFGDPRASTRQGYASPGSGVIETTMEWPDARLTVRQRAGVLPGHEAFVSAIEISGAGSAPRVIWVADFAPVTRQIPELPIRDGALDALNGFAAFANRAAGRVWSFRPQNPGKAEWTRARGLVAGDAALEAWTDFADGAWIGVASSAPVINLVVASTPRELMGALESRATLLSASVGPSNVGIEPAPVAQGGGYRAWIAVSVGANLVSGAKALDDAAIAAGGFFDAAPETAVLPAEIASLDPKFLPSATRHWITLRALHDAQTGLTVRDVSAVPPLARDWPREGALAAWALFEIGERDAAERSLEAYFGKIRSVDRPRRPLGSMPESLYTDGDPASPHFIVDDRGPARVLWVADRMLRDRPEAERTAWVRKHWKGIEATAEFLSTWSDARYGAPLYAVDPVGLADAETQDRLFAVHAGMAAALRLGDYAGGIAPETWRVRHAQLRDMAERVLITPEKWIAGDALVLEFEGLSEDALVQAHELTLRRLENPIALGDRALASLLLESGLLHEHAPDRAALPSLGTIEAVLDRIATTSAAGSIGPDARVSSQVLLAILALRRP